MENKTYMEQLKMILDKYYPEKFLGKDIEEYPYEEREWAADSTDHLARLLINTEKYSEQNTYGHITGLLLDRGMKMKEYHLFNLLLHEIATEELRNEYKERCDAGYYE